jgi:hypothetical protein
VTSLKSSRTARTRSKNTATRGHRLSVLPLEDRTVPTGGPVSTDLVGVNALPPAFLLDNPAGFMTGLRAGDPLSLALSDAVAHAGQAGLLPGDVGDAVIADNYRDGGVTHVYLRQMYNGLPVYNTSLGIHIKDGGQLLDIGGEFVPGLSAKDGGPGAIPAPAVTAGQAVQLAAAYFGYPAGAPTVTSGPVGVSNQTVLSAPQASDLPITAKLVYVYTSGGVRPSWEFSLRTPDGQHWFDAAVDTQTGAVTFQADWQDNFAPATYDVYPIPLRSPTDATPAPPGDGRTVLVNPFNPVTSPAGWQNDGTPGGQFTDTRGNNVDAQADLFSTNDSTIRPDAGPSLQFVYPLDLTQRPQAYLNAAVTNLFYVNNLLHDVHAVYGFDEAAGNFQQTNYSGQGVGGDPVQADAQDGGGFDNANFATPPDGQQPRMQMYVWPYDLNFNSIDPTRDGDIDNEIMLHEYGHGVSNRLTGGPADSNALTSVQSGGMGEGWSDWWATMFTQTVNSTQNAAYPTGTYVLNQPANGPGIRSFPYSFDMTIDKHTFDDYGTSGTSALSGLQRSTEVHATGEIWGSALWDMNWLLINKYGFDPDLTTGYDPTATSGPKRAGNKLALKLVMDALKLQPANPSFTQARDAILLADRNLTGGANQREIWTAFARRGLGFSAFSASADDPSINIAFDMPPAATAAPAIISQLITAPAGGPNQIAKVTGLTAPTQITLTFSAPMDPNTFSVAASVASFTGPGGIDLKPSITTINWQNGSAATGFTQLQINFAPPAAAQGQYVMVLGPDIRDKRANPTAEAQLDQNLNGVPGEATADQYTASFAYDPTVLQVIGVTPNLGAAAANNLTTISLTFNEPIDPASISTGSLQLSSGTITNVSLSNGNKVAQFTVSGLATLGEVPVYMSMKYGAVTDAAASPADEFPVQVFNSNFTLDITSAAMPSPMAVDGPVGWRSYQSMFNLPTQVNVPGDKDDFTINMEAGSQLSVAIDSVAGTLRPVLKVFDPSNTQVATATAGANGQSISYTSIPVPTGGVYTVEVSGNGTTTGAYRIRVLANTAVEAQAFGGAASNTQASAQAIGPAFETIAPGVDMANVYGKTFASGALSTEVEPNNTLALSNDTTRNFVSVPGTNLYQLSFTGVIAKASDQNWFKIGAMQIGDIFTVTVSGAWGWQAGGFLPDSYVQLVNSTGPVAGDDNSGPISAALGVGDSLIYRFAISKVDTYYIEVLPSPFTPIPTDLGAYRVGVLLENTNTAPTTGGTATNNTGTSNTQGTAIDNSAAWKKVQYDSVVTGTIGVIGDTDLYKYTFAAGDVITLHVAASGGWSPTVNLLDSNGLSLVDEDGTSVGMLPNSDVYSYTVKTAGTYYVSVGARGSGGAYTVTVDLSPSGTPLTPLPSAVDYYLLPALTAGQVLTVGIDQLTAGGNAAVDLIYHNPVNNVDTVVASGQFGPTNFNRVINGFVVPTSGTTYFLRVTDAAPFEYLLSILRNGLLEQESNDSVNAPQAIGAATATPTTVVGGITAGDADWYSFTVDAASAAAGNALVIQTSTPGDLPGEPQNTLDPELEVYRPDGTLLLADDNSAPDGRNAFIRVTANTPGTYKVRVLSVGGTTGAYVLTLSTSPNQPPASVVPGGPYTINEGDSLTLTTSAVDPDHDPLTFSWDINGDGMFGDATGANPTLTWAQLVALGIADGPATFNVQVEVTDPYHPPVISAKTTLSVVNTNPTAMLSNGGSVPEGSPGLVTFTNQFDPSPVDTKAGFHYAYDFNNDGTWDLGDGTYAGSAGGASVPVPAAFLPDGPGTYTVKARIIDKDGGFTDYTTTITVTNVPPTATLTNGGTVPEGSPGSVSFTNQFDPSPVDTAVGFHYSYDFNNDGLWDLGDGTYAGSAGVPANATVLGKYFPDGPGTATIKGRIIDKDGGFTDYTTTITITNVPPTATLTNGGAVVEGSSGTVSFSGQFDPSPVDTAAGFHYAYDFNNDGIWDIGDGTYAASLTSSTMTVPAQFLADGPGTRVVKARIIDKDGGFNDYTTTITILNAPPTATFTTAAGSSKVNEGQTGSVTFVNPTDPSAADIAAGFHFAYDFNNDGKFEIGDGTYAGSVPTGTAIVPASFLSDGPATVVIHGRIIDKDGGFTDYTTTITVVNVPPSATFGSGGNVVVGNPSTVVFTNPTDPSPADVAAGFTYSYDFNNDGNFTSPGDIASTTAAMASVTFPAPGTYTVHGRITDKDGGSTDYTTSVVVTPIPPTPPSATLGNSGPVAEGGTATVTFSNVTHPNPASVAAGFRYAYDFNNDGIFDVGDGTYAGSVSTPTATVPATLLGDGPVTRTVHARVIEINGGFADYTTDVVVTNVPPTAVFSGGTAALGTPATVFFSQQTDPSKADVSAGFTYSFDFNNDGNFTSPGDVADSKSPSAAFTFPNPGKYTVHGRIADKDGGSSDYTATVVVPDVPPTGTLVAPPTAAEGDIVTLQVTGVSHPSPAAVTAGFHYSYDFNGDGVWDLGDGTYAGSAGVGASVTVPPGSLNGPGSTLVRARVIDVYGGFTDLAATIKVTNTPPTAVFGGLATATATAPVTFAFTQATDPSNADTAAGFTYSFDFNNDGNFTSAGDVAGSKTPTANFTFATAGTYTVHGRITDQDGGSTDYTTTVVVSPLPQGSTGPRGYTVGADAGTGPIITLYDQNGVQKFTGSVFDPTFTGGVRVATGDVNGDGVPDLIVGTGPGIPTQVRVLDGVDQHQLFSINPFESSFTGGVFVATGDFLGDGKQDVIVTPDEGGGPRVIIYGGSDLHVIANFFGISDPNFRGGARAAAGDVNGDGHIDLVVAAGFGGGPRVAIWDGRTVGTANPVRLVPDFFVFEQTLRNGVYVASGDINGDGSADVIFGGGPGGGPRVFALSGKDLLAGQNTVLANFFAGDDTTRGGIRVAVTNLDGDNRADVLVGSGAGDGSRVIGYLGKNTTPAGEPPQETSFDAFRGFTGGVFVG